MKTIKKSVVKQVQSNGTWEGKFGMMYKFEVEFENGDTGEYSSKLQEQTKFVEGNETEYEFIDGKFPKVKPVYAPPSSNGFGFKRDDNVQGLIVKQSSLKAAVDYCDNNKCSPEQICEVAQIFNDWVMGKESITNNTFKENNDVLPF